MARRAGRVLVAITCCLTALGAGLGHASATPTATTAAPIPPNAWIVADAGTGEILDAHDDHTPYPPASTTKIMTALTAVERLPPDATITVSALAAAQPASKINMQGGPALDVHGRARVADRRLRERRRVRDRRGDLGQRRRLREGRGRHRAPARAEGQHLRRPGRSRRRQRVPGRPAHERVRHRDLGATRCTFRSSRTSRRHRASPSPGPTACTTRSSTTTSW